MAGQIAAILDEEGRVSFQEFIIAVGKTGREATAADDDAFGRDLGTVEILLHHHPFAGGIGSRQHEGL